MMIVWLVLIMNDFYYNLYYFLDYYVIMNEYSKHIVIISSDELQ